MTKVALCMRGAISKIDHDSKRRGEIYDRSSGYLNFVAVYNSIRRHIFDANPHKIHFWIKNFVENHMGRPMIMDKIEPGKHQEVMRPQKMRDYAINAHGIKPEHLYRYGVTKDDLRLD